MLYVDTVDVSDNTDGTVDVVLECDGTRVRCTGVAWFDEQDNEEMLALFEEWYSMAQMAEPGYAVLA